MSDNTKIDWKALEIGALWENTSQSGAVSWGGNIKIGNETHKIVVYPSRPSQNADPNKKQASHRVYFKPDDNSPRVQANAAPQTQQASRPQQQTANRAPQNTASRPVRQTAAPRQATQEVSGDEIPI